MGRAVCRKASRMFAFAVVELPQGRNGRATSVFLARDPLGIKPLDYVGGDGAFVFAPKCARCWPAAASPPQLSEEAVPSYLLFGSVCEPINGFWCKAYFRSRQVTL